MLTLLLLRHAKSSWDHSNLDDFERPLADRGRQAAPLMGRYLAKHHLQPDLILCSSAMRTQQTLELVRASFSGCEPAVRYEDDLYLAPSSNLLGHLKRVSQRWKRVLLVGHNPGMQELAVRLAGSGDPAALRAMSEKYPTAGLAVFTFDAARWSEIAAQTGRLVSFVTPRSLKA